jgi:hypothetical protein
MTFSFQALGGYLVKEKSITKTDTTVHVFHFFITWKAWILCHHWTSKVEMEVTVMVKHTRASHACGSPPHVHLQHNRQQHSGILLTVPNVSYGIVCIVVFANSNLPISHLCTM